MSFAAVISRLQALENPYPGLRPFETAESHLFFGRDAQIAEVVGRLERNRFLGVLGVSGSGKSSLVRAGLMPALERGSITNPGRHWRMVVTRPAGAPFDSLAAALTSCGLDPSPLRDSSQGLVQVARQLTPDERLLVIVDQFEEVFRYKDRAATTQEARREVAATAADAAEFVQLLLAAGRHHPPVYVVLTMRSDYLGDCAEFRDLPETLNDCQYLLPRMSRDQRKEAIERPLGRVEIAPSLVQRMLNDAGDEPGQLPVLQHALMRTWSHWRQTDPGGARRIDVSDYVAVGGFDDALNRHADELLTGVSADIAAVVFKRLTARGRGRRERRDPATLAELWAVCGADTPERQAAVTAVVERFRRGEATFLSPRDGEISPETYIDITHESLIRQWARLRDGWLPEEEASGKKFLELADRARRWTRSKAESLIGADLVEAVEWNRERNQSSAWAAHYSSGSDLALVLEFIDASVRHEREETIAKARERRRLRLAVTSAITAVIAGLAAIVVYQYRAARMARLAASEARILSAPSVKDPLVRALLLAELAPYATDAHLTIYQEAATAAIPVAVRRHTGSGSVRGIGFVGDRIAAAFADGTLVSWRRDGHGDGDTQVVADLPRVASTSRTAPWITAVAFSPDGQWMAMGLCTADVWVQRIGSTRARFTAPAGASCPQDAPSVTALAFSRDGRLLVAGDRNSATHVWPLDGTSEGPITGAPAVFGGDQAGSRITSVDVDAAGTRVATGSNDGSCRIWSRHDMASRVFTLGSNDAVTRVAFSPDGAWLLCGYQSGAARLWSTQDRSTASVDLPGHMGAVTAVAFSADRSKVATASVDRTARVWMIRPENNVGASAPVAPQGLEHGAQPPTLGIVESTRTLRHDTVVTGLAFSPDSQTIVTTADDATVRVWSADQREPRVLGLHDLAVESVAFDRDGRRVASGSDDSTVGVWAVDGSLNRRFRDHTDWVRNVAFSPANPQELLTSSADGLLRIWASTLKGENRVAREVGPGPQVFSASFDPQGGRVVTAVQDGMARVWTLAAIRDGGWHTDLSAENAPIELRHKGWVLSAAFNRDGSRIVTGSQDGTVAIWKPDRSTDVPERTFFGNGKLFASVAFSPDGSQIVAGSADGIARIWRVDGVGDPIELRHLGDVRKAMFNSKGDAILTASLDGTAKVWSAAGVERLVLAHGAERVMAAAFDPKDERVVTGSGEGVIRLWRVTLPALRDYVSGATTACLTPSQRMQYFAETEAAARSAYARCESRFERSVPPATPAPVSRQVR